jgi:RNA polymerase sigma-70 factor (ECF subfamily)
MQIFTRLSGTRELRRRLAECRENLYRIAYAWCHDTTLADDLVQDTLGKALRHADQLREATRLDAWLLRIMSNCWRDHFRRQHDTLDIDEMDYTDGSTPESDHVRDEMVTQVRHAVAALPEGQRQVLTLVDLEGSGYAEVAEILGIPVGTVMSRLSRARQCLKDRLLKAAKRETSLEENPGTVVTFRRST